MKTCLTLLLAACLLAASAFAEEAFFEETFFGDGLSLQDEFFEESGLFGEEADFLAEEEDAPLPEAPGAGDGETQDRSLVLTYTDYGIWNSSVWIDQAWMSPVTELVAKPTKKANEVRLSWTHLDFRKASLPKIKSLPKNVQYVVYELDQDPTDGSYIIASHAWIQVAKTRSTSIILKNQPAGEHYYVVRPEYLKGGKEIWGFLYPDLSAGVTVTKSNMWKTVSSVALRQESYASPRIHLSFIVKERSASYTYTWRYKVGKKWKTGGKDILFSYGTQERLIRGGKPIHRYQNLFIDVSDAVNEGAVQFEVTVTPRSEPYGAGAPGKPKSAKITLKLGGDDWKSPPEIVRCERVQGGVRLTFRHDVTAGDYDDYYEVYDGKKLAQRAWCDPGLNRIRTVFVPLPAGTHQLKIRAVSPRITDFREKGAFSPAVTAKIPQAANDYPVITSASVDGATQYVQVAWTCANPDVYRYWVYVADWESSEELLNGISMYGEPPALDSPANGYEYAAVMVPGSACSLKKVVSSLTANKYPYFIIVQGTTPGGKVFTSDVVRVGSAGTSVIQLAR